MKRRYTREELHELVWSTPMHKLAPQFGISDRGLAKTCARHLIPVPPRGYWAKLEAGQNVKKTKLRSVENKHLHTVDIGSAQPRMSDSVRQIVIDAKVQKAQEAKEKKSIRAERATSPSAAIEEPGDSPHKSIANLAKRLRKAKPDKEGLLHLAGLAIHEQSRERAVTILHNLAIRCQAKLARIALDGEHISLVFDLGPASITLTEQTKRVEHVPSEKELVELQRLKAKRERELPRGLWHLGRLEPWPEFDIVYTGNLTLAYDAWTSGIRRSWSDGKTQTVEKVLDAFVDGGRLILAAKAEEARLSAEREHRRHEMMHRRLLAEKRAKREEDRLKYLRAIAEIRGEVANLRATINLIPSTDNLPAEYQRMIEWAQTRLADLEAKTTVDQIQASLVAQALFPEVDDLHDPKGEPPQRVNYWDD